MHESLNFLTRTKVHVGVKRTSQHDPDATHHVLVKEDGKWVTLCLGSPAFRSYLGWLETAVDCFRCPADYNASGQQNSPTPLVVFEPVPPLADRLEHKRRTEALERLRCHNEAITR